MKCQPIEEREKTTFEPSGYILGDAGSRKYTSGIIE